MRRTDYFSRPPEYLYGHTTEGFVIDHIEDGALTWRGCDLYPSIRRVRQVLAGVLREMRKENWVDGRYDFRVVYAELLDGELERGGVYAERPFRYVIHNGKLRRHRANSLAL